MLADFGELIGSFFALILVVSFFLAASWFFLKWMNGDYDNKDDEKDHPKSKKFNVPKINLPKFKDSGWVLFYVIFGWISLVLMIVFFVQENSTFAFMMLGCSLSCFFAAHILRVQEKAAFFAEQSVEESKKQTELLEKISSEKSPIIEDKEK
jgi:high-affinity Fe2+/Pb2+ permease